MKLQTLAISALLTLTEIANLSTRASAQTTFTTPTHPILAELNTKAVPQPLTLSQLKAPAASQAMAQRSQMSTQASTHPTLTQTSEPEIGEDSGVPNPWQ